MRYLFLLLPVIFAFSSLGYARDVEDDSEVVEETAEEDNEQNYDDQEDSDEENEEGSDAQQSASIRSQRKSVSVYGNSPRQKFGKNQQHRARTNQSADAESIRKEDNTKKVEIVQHEARFDHVTHEIIVETKPYEPQYLNSSDDNDSPEVNSEVEPDNPQSLSEAVPVRHEFIIETEPSEPRYLNDEYWAENGKDEEENISKEEPSDSMEEESSENEEETDNDD